MIKPNGEIPLTPEYFPDEAFRELLSALIDVDKNGILTLEEREQLTELRNTCYDMENSETDEYYEVHTPRNEAERTMYFWLNRVVSLEGIEYFPKLRLLVVDETAEREWYYSNAFFGRTNNISGIFPCGKYAGIGKCPTADQNTKCNNKERAKTPLPLLTATFIR